MESTALLHHGCPKLLTKTPIPRLKTPTRNLKPASPWRISAVMAEPKSSQAAAAKPMKPANKEEKTVYNDNWFDRLAIHHLSLSVQLTTGLKNNKEGYESLIEAASAVAKNYDANDQRKLVIEALKTAFPKAILDTIKTVARPSKLTREFFAVFTTVFFPWLVGKCEVRESEFQGKKEKNVVYIPKCRFLEGTNCVGMCNNLCKIPSQKFIQDSLGMPVYMSPNFEDMSCEMIFGQSPPEDDPALKQPCYKKLCIAKQMHDVNCAT